MEKQPINPKSGVSNDAAFDIATPFRVEVTIQGTADILFHRWSDDDVEEKSKAAKGSKSKKTDNVEAYVYRDDQNQICIPGRYITRAIVEAARFHQDPRSSRKMAKDLVQASIVSTPTLSPVLIGGKPTEAWGYLDRQRVVIQRSAISRIRPAFLTGWECNFEIISLLPEYVTLSFLRRLLDDAGRFVGLGDFRPTYGRFNVTHWAVTE